MSILSNNANYVRYLLFAFNLIFLITGIALIAVGLVVTSAYAKYDGFIESNFFAVPTFLIVIGVFVIIITFLGCWGSLKESYRLMVIFSLLLAIIFIFELSAGISGYVLKDSAEAKIESSLTRNLANYKENTLTATTVLWDDVQDNFGCCGVHNYTDWTSLFAQNLPLSCCSIPKGVVGTFECTASENNVFRHGAGCLTSFASYVADHAISLGAAGIVIAIIQFFGVIFAIFMAREIKIRNGITGWF